ncbi:MAG: hypothetical protein R3F21_02755 [Myxococcota bacterium]
MPLPLRLLAALPGALFGLIAFQWLVTPGDAANALDLPLLSGAARSTQIGDTGAFFLGVGASFVLGAVRLERQWFQAAALLVGGAAFYRTVAWAMHGAPLPIDKIGIELFTLAIAAFAASRCRGGR